MAVTVQVKAWHCQVALAVTQLLFCIGSVYLKSSLLSLGVSGAREFHPIVYAFIREAVAGAPHPSQLRPSAVSLHASLSAAGKVSELMSGACRSGHVHHRLRPVRCAPTRCSSLAIKQCLCRLLPHLVAHGLVPACAHPRLRPGLVSTNACAACSEGWQVPRGESSLVQIAATEPQLAVHLSLAQPSDPHHSSTVAAYVCSSTHETTHNSSSATRLCCASHETARGCAGLLPRREHLAAIGGLGVCLYFNQLCYIVGIDLSGVLVATCMQPAIPVFTAMLAVLLRFETGSWQKAGGIAAAVTGSICMVRGVMHRSSYTTIPASCWACARSC